MKEIERQKIVLELTTKPIKDWKGICLHHSATVDGKVNDIEAIRRFHKSWRVDGVIVDEKTYTRKLKDNDGHTFLKPWKEIGYHFLTEQRGEEIVWDFGRPLDMDGAHAGTSKSNFFNTAYIGVCAVGNYDKIEPPKEIWDTCLEICRVLTSYFEIPKQCVIGHREVYDQLFITREKTCPGLKWDLQAFRDQL